MGVSITRKGWKISITERISITEHETSAQASAHNVNDSVEWIENGVQNVHNIHDNAAKRSNRKYPAWQSGVRGLEMRWIISCIMLAELVAYLTGYLINNGHQETLDKVLRWSLAFACNMGFEIISETWLDWVRMKSLRKCLVPEGKETFSVEVYQLVLLEVNVLREHYHARDQKEGAIASLPYLGPQNWHYETSACIRDVMLSITVMLLYVFDESTFAFWWDDLVAGTYVADMAFLLTRWPAISSGWLRFVSIHHICTMLFLVLGSLLTTENHHVVYRCIALIWISNALTTFPIVHRSLVGRENGYLIIFGFVGQRLLRWGGAIAAVVEMKIDSVGTLRQYLLQTPYLHIVGIIFLLLLEVVDVPPQFKKSVVSAKKLWHKNDEKIVVSY